MKLSRVLSLILLDQKASEVKEYDLPVFTTASQTVLHSQFDIVTMPPLDILMSLLQRG